MSFIHQPPTPSAQPTLGVFLLTTSDPPNRIVPMLEGMTEVRNWYGFLGSAYLVASRKTAQELSAKIRELSPGCWFVVSQVHSWSTDGFISQDVWNFVNNPTDSGRHPPEVQGLIPSAFR